MKLYLITVLYNRSVKEIRSLAVLLSFLRYHQEAEVFLVDNSTDEEIMAANAALTQSAKEKFSGRVHYVQVGYNAGLSRAYNLALEKIEDEDDFWVMLADDDTLFSRDYLESAYRVIRNNLKGLKVLCGVVETGKNWISPRSMHTSWMAFSFWLRRPKPGIYRNLNPINSGLFLEGKTLRSIGGFDERLFLDQVDFLLMDRLRAAGVDRVGVTGGKILQSFSGDGGVADAQKARARWEIFKKDFRMYCELTGKSRVYEWYILLRRRAMMLAAGVR